MSTLNILCDADVLVFVGSLTGETTTDWGNGVVTTTYDIEKSKRYVDSKTVSVVSAITEYKKHKGDIKVIQCLSDKVNFRKSLYPEYKANRTKEKPKLYQELREYTEKNYECKCFSNLEADDTIAYLATSLDNAVIASIDKDYLTVPNTVFFNWNNETFTETTEESAMYNHYYQCLIGDSIDFYNGCDGIGKVKAKRILDNECSWEAVVRTYESKGQTEEKALLMARLAKLLTKDLYVDGKVILWTPKASL